MTEYPKPPRGVTGRDTDVCSDFSFVAKPFFRFRPVQAQIVRRSPVFPLTRLADCQMFE